IATSFPSNQTDRTPSSVIIDNQEIFYNYSQSYPSGTSIELHTVNYYDSYDNVLPSGLANTITNYYGVTSVANVKGLATVSKVRVLNTSSWITSVTYYDAKSRPIYVYSKNDFLGTIDIIENKLAFDGRVLETKTTHQKTGESDIITIDRFEYDHAGRLLTQTQDVSNAVSRRLVKNNYDGLGRLESKLIDNGTQDGYKDVIGTSISNDIITSTAGNGWNNSGFATNGNITGDGYVEYEIPQSDKYVMVGLSQTNQNNSYNTIEYGLYNRSNGMIYIYESGSYKGYYGTYTIGDIFRIERIGSTVYYKKNGTIIYTSTVPSTGTLLGDIAFWHNQAKLKDLKIVDNSKGLQTVDYKYNVRGWLTDINDINNLGDDLFTFNIRYDNPSTGTALYNGNISQTLWRTKNVDNGIKEYLYTYDALNRLTSADWTIDRYRVWGILYDKNGNLTRLYRKGHTNSAGSTFGIMDMLHYTYEPNSNKLKKVFDDGGNPNGFNDGVDQTTEYTYDANGNMITDANKGITNITYNHLNLPTQVTINGQNISYVYDALGGKQRKTVGSTNTDYAGNYVYENNNLQFFNHSEGYITPNGSSFKYIYQYKDHLGNVRLSYADGNGDGVIAQSEIIEENNYYPFGLKHKGYNTVVNSGGNSVAERFKYNGKEFEEDLNFNVMDYGMRRYMPDLGRWMSTDALAEKYESVSPYNYVLNNPINATDPDGRLVIYVNGLLFDEALAHKSAGIFGKGGFSSHYKYPPPRNFFYNQEPSMFGQRVQYWGATRTIINNHFVDKKNIFINGTDNFTSQATDRFAQGKTSGLELIAKLQNGEIELANEETIKVVGHSQGAAFAAGILSALSDSEYASRVELGLYLSPHQPGDFAHPEGIAGAQFSTRSDWVSSRAPIGKADGRFMLRDLMNVLNGGSELKEIEGADFLYIRPNHDGGKGGHDVDTWNSILQRISDFLKKDNEEN
ncbi:MAG: hypothetical protein HKN90_09465, partial [Flavobacteriaceae bacterium]|nr:hypothetical protein [Flavobacteriaceae bacterium]